MWAGRFSKELHKDVNDFNSSIRIDGKMYVADIKGSMAHAFMLGEKGIIPKDESLKIISTLEKILIDIESGDLRIDHKAEDIHMFVEEELTKRIGILGKKLHTARSRNDQVALDIRIYLKEEITDITSMIKKFIETLIKLSENHIETIMPGYTHLQRAQPITLAHHLLTYVYMLKRDVQRLKETQKRMDYSPLGSAAIAGTTYNIDRMMVANKLGFQGVVANSIDGVSDRDFVIELAANLAISMMHLSRLSEELILWCSWEFKFIELDDAYATGSSIMPQKKNPDIAELVRGKTGRVYGNLMAVLTIMKALPLSYNKDMQEDKEAIFDSIETFKLCISIIEPMINSMKVNKDKMYQAAASGFINATDAADYLVKKGLAFREAYKIVGSIVGDCIKKGNTLETMTIEEYKKYSILFENDIFEAISLKNCVQKRISEGGTSPKSVLEQIRKLKGDK